MHVRVLMAVGLAAAAFSLTGCQSVERSLAPEPVVVTQEATAAAAAAPVVGTLAENTPRELPLWPQSSVVSSEVDSGTYSVELSTTDPYEDVLNGVAAGFERSGWSVVVEDEGDVGLRTAVLTVTSDKYEGLVTISETESSTVSIDYYLTGAAG